MTLNAVAYICAFIVFPISLFQIFFTLHLLRKEKERQRNRATMIKFIEDHLRNRK